MNTFLQICSKAQADDRYYPPVLGNGDLSLAIDYEGCQRQITRQFMTPAIFRAGKRYFAPGYPLINFGYFMQDFGSSDLIDWTQTLDTENAIMTCNCVFSDGLKASSRIFCHAERALIAFSVSLSETREYKFRHSIPYQRRLAMSPVSNHRIAYDADSMNHDRGNITLIPPEGAQSFAWQDGLSFSIKGRDFTFFLAFDEEESTFDYESLYASHQKNWHDFWNEGYVRLPSEAIERMYHTGLYHLKIFSTKWSIPMGLFPLHWEGRYFGYDEIYSFDALLSSGHLALAKKIPEFRHSLLGSELQRHKATCEKRGVAMSFPVETLENGQEGTPPGFWCEHIFQTAHIGICAGWYAKYSGDKAFLREKGYPLMRSCAEYFRLGHIYRTEDHKTIIGKCTDLERLGAFVENGFVTTCSVICLFRLASEYAEQLGLDGQLAAEWKRLAEELKEGLPKDNEKYLPRIGYAQRSIAVYTGLYPYGVTSENDPLQKAAILDADAHWEDFALQYTTGGKVMSSWYKGMICLAYAHCGRLADAAELLESAAHSVGCFHECFEIYDWRYRPWFSTAAGALVRAINAMFVQNGALVPGILKTWPDFEVKLQIENGRMLYARAVSGALQEQKIIEP